MKTLIANEKTTSSLDNRLANLDYPNAQQAWASGADLAVALRPDFITLFEYLPNLGEIETLVTNCAVRYQQKGQYSPARWQKTTGLVLNPRALDQRLFSSEWQSLFAIQTDSSVALQIFDNQGLPVMTIRPTPLTNLVEWKKIIEFFQWEKPEAPRIQAKDTIKPAAATPHLTIDLEMQWRAMTDVHQFFGLLRQNKLSRQQAFRLVPEDLACQVDKLAIVSLIKKICNDGNEIMIFVTNNGCIQIFTGSVQQVLFQNGNLEIKAEQSTINIDTAQISESWLTRKPSEGGHVTSLELFNDKGEQIAQLYGQRTEGQAEQTTWRKQVEALAPLEGTV